MWTAVSRAPGAQRVVSPLELFFDLVYVFALGQLAHHLLAHVDLRTGAETVILALAVFHAWHMTAWGVNWLEPERSSGLRRRAPCWPRSRSPTPSGLRVRSSARHSV